MYFETQADATPIDPDEAAGLIPLHIQTQGELNEWEQANILQAETWAFGKRHQRILTMSSCKELHKRIFDKTWQWAGKFRLTNKNIGVFWEQVPMQLQQLLDNVAYQVEKQTEPLDETIMRFHHQLVLIHPFPNGNGRHARMMADRCLQSLGVDRFSWGAKNNASLHKTRQQYIQTT